MFDGWALMMVMMWPLVPMSLIELHFAVDFWRRLGGWTFPVLLLEWLPIAFVIYLLRGAILYYDLRLGSPFFVLGIIAIIAGVALHSWTAKLLGIKATVGYTELRPETQTKEQTLVTSGPFAVVRHPSYWAHTSIIVGFFLITSIAALGIIAIIDMAITYFITTELEDRELIERFGDQYREYQKKVPKYFPKLTASPEKNVSNISS